MNSVRALHVPADKTTPVTVQAMDDSYDGVLTVLGANTADMVVLDDRIAAWVDGNGKLESLPRNPRAARLVNSFVPGWTMYDMIHGDAVFVGLDQETAVYSDVPDFLITRMSNLSKPVTL